MTINHEEIAYPMRRKPPALWARFIALAYLAVVPSLPCRGATPPASGEIGLTASLAVDQQPLEMTDGSSSVVDSGCESAGCIPQSCCTLCPCSYFWAEALILTRDNDSRNRPLALDLNTNDVLLSSGDLDFDWDAGFRIGYDTRLCDCWSAEFIYLGVFDQSAADSVELADSLMLPGNLGLQVNNFFGADDVGVRYSSDLHSFEANLVHCCCCDVCGPCHSIEWLTGFRYLHLGEEFRMSSFDSAEGTSIYNAETDNNLYGMQIGSRYRVCRSGCWSWETTGKAGIYGNSMEQSQAPIVDFPNFVFRTGRGGDETDVAFVGELNATAIYHLTRMWGLRTGYNLIWLEGVALAPDQVDFTNTPDSGRKLVDGGGVFLHGFNIGVEARW